MHSSTTENEQNMALFTLPSIIFDLNPNLRNFNLNAFTFEFQTNDRYNDNVENGYEFKRTRKQDANKITFKKFDRTSQFTFFRDNASPNITSLGGSSYPADGDERYKRA